MSVLMKIVRNATYLNYQYKASNSLIRLPTWGRNFHRSSFLSIKMHMEYENHYAYNVLQNKGYAVDIYTDLSGQVIPEKQFKDLLEEDWSKKPPGIKCEAFRTLALYCSNHNLCISNTKFDSFIDYLTDSFKFATNKELESIFYSLNKWPETKSIRTRNYIEVWVALDDECLRRHKDWSFDELLSFISLFYMLNVVKYSDFCVKSLNKLATKAKQLTSGQLVQTLFFVGIWRTAPFDMHNLEIQLDDTLTSFSVDDLAVMSMGFFKSKTPIRDTNLVLKIINIIVENSKNIHEVSLAALLKLVRYSSKVVLDDRIHRLLETLQYEVPRLSVMCNVHLALLGTTTLNCHKGCLNEIAEYVNNHMSQTRVKDLERLVLTYGTFDYSPKTKDCFFTKVIDELRKPDRTPEIMKYGRSFACCIAYLTLMGIYPEDLINRVLSNEFLEKVYGKQCYNYGREVLTLHYTAEIHCHNRITNRLTEKIVKILAKKYTDYVPSEEYKKQYNITERMVLDILRLLKEFRGGHKYVIADHILPYHQRGDIILCDDKFGAPVEVQDMFPSVDFGLLRRPPDNDHNFTVLVIAGRNALIHGTDRATGPFFSKIRDLEALGYNATLVPWSLFSKLETSQEKIAFLNTLIKSCQKSK